MRSVFYWEAAGLALDRANPYGGLLARAMAEVGVDMVAGHAGDLDEAWLLENRHQVDVLHLNWPHTMYQASDLESLVSRCAALIDHLSRARSLGYKIVWTVHNLYPHETANHEMEHLMRLAITHLANALIVHCQRARALVEKHFFRTDEVFVIPHGHFIDPYPNTLTRSQARQRLGLDPDCFAYLFFGNIRPYKGVEHLLETFARLPDPDAVLLLVGKVNNEYNAALVERAAQADPRVAIFTSDFFQNEELQLYFNAADVVVLPFVDVLTSGSTITAMSFKRPVIVPPIGCLSELVDEHMGILYDPHQPDALHRAMCEVRQRDLKACGAAAYHRAESLSWDGIARQTLEVYRA